jgi:putative amide transporter protein
VTSIGLFLAGSVLFINGLSLLGRCDAASAAPVNAFVGTLLLAIVASTLLHVTNPAAPQNQQATFGAVGFLLFAFTYLWVAINSWTGASGTGLGWYCLWAAAASLFLAVVNFTRFHDPRFGMLWLLWAVLFTLFFLVRGLELKALERATGWATTIEAFVTTTIPGALLLLGEWRSVSDAAAVAVGLITIVLVGLLGARGFARSHARPSHADQPPVRGATRPAA